MNRAEVVDIADALRRFPGVRHATARDRDAESAAAHSVWVVSFAVSADDLGREAAELIRMAVQESSRVQLREATASAGLVRYAL
ncbi:MAG TPA: hypothetical protein VML55_09290, partial [Planctomycetaceae bacterium]|nr:hypothetical protein [Planctomycetaceae bacterium]